MASSSVINVSVASFVGGFDLPFLYRHQATPHTAASNGSTTNGQIGTFDFCLGANVYTDWRYSETCGAPMKQVAHCALDGYVPRFSRVDTKLCAAQSQSLLADFPSAKWDGIIPATSPRTIFPKCSRQSLHPKCPATRRVIAPSSSNAS